MLNTSEDVKPKVKFSRGGDVSSTNAVINPDIIIHQPISGLRIPNITETKKNEKKPSTDLPFLNLILPKNFPINEAKASPKIDMHNPTKANFPKINTLIHTPTAITLASLREFFS